MGQLSDCPTVLFCTLCVECTLAFPLDGKEVAFFINSTEEYQRCKSRFDLVGSDAAESLQKGIN